MEVIGRALERFSDVLRGMLTSPFPFFVWLSHRWNSSVPDGYVTDYRCVDDKV